MSDALFQKLHLLDTKLSFLYKTARGIATSTDKHIHHELANDLNEVRNLFLEAMNMAIQELNPQEDEENTEENTEENKDVPEELQQAWQEYQKQPHAGDDLGSFALFLRLRQLRQNREH